MALRNASKALVQGLTRSIAFDHGSVLMFGIAHIAVLRAGVIGTSWAALILASGRTVTVDDPVPNAEAAM